MKIKDFLRKSIESKYFLLIFFLFWFLLFSSLSFFRDAQLDENIYIADSVTISNILRNFEWIGNHGVGLHGFLSKLLLGIIFLFTGPSVFIATFLNIVFSLLSGVLFYHLLSNHFKLGKRYSLLGVTLLFTSYQFITYTPTFYRDIESVLLLLLVLNSVLSGRNKWLTGFFLLLLLDSKEHVFYTVAPAFLLWVGIESYINNKGDIWKTIKEFTFNNLKLFLLPLIFLILMFITSIIPLNIYNANILGLIEEGIGPMVSNFDLEMATHNRDIEVNKETAEVVPTVSTPDSTSSILSGIITSFNIAISYVGKILYPRTFSFLSIPFVVLIPSIFSAWGYFLECLKKKKTEGILLPILLILFLVIYVSHASISRYILPISPIIFLFFLLFLTKFPKDEGIAKRVLVFTIAFTIAGLYFEYSYVSIKIIINLILISLLLLVYFRKLKGEFLKYLLIILLSIFSIGTALMASYKYGQIRGYLLYGYNRECENIISLVDENDVVLINDIGWDKVPFFLRGEELGESEWRWALKSWIPKKNMLIGNNDVKTFDFYWGNIDNLKEEVQKNRINKIMYVYLEERNEKEDFLLQDRLDVLLDTNWLELTEEKQMKNKRVYIFNVKDVFSE